MISLIIPELRNAYFAELADSVMRAASEHGLSVLIEQFGNDRASELTVLRRPSEAAWSTASCTASWPSTSPTDRPSPR